MSALTRFLGLGADGRKAADPAVTEDEDKSKPAPTGEDSPPAEGEEDKNKPAPTGEDMPVDDEEDGDGETTPAARAAHGRGRRAERSRIAAIVNGSGANAETALALALNSNMSSKAAKGVLAALPKAAPQASGFRAAMEGRSPTIQPSAPGNGKPAATVLVDSMKAMVAKTAGKGN